MDYTAATTAIGAVLTDASGILGAILLVTVGFYAFRKIKGNVK